MTEIRLGDFAKYQARQQYCERMKKLSPQNAKHIRQAEVRWLAGSANAAIADSRELAKIDPQAAMTGLRNAFDALHELDMPNETRSSLTEARAQTMEVVLNDLREKAITLIEEDAYEEAFHLVENIDREVIDEAHITGFEQPLSDFRNSYRYLHRVWRTPQ